MTPSPRILIADDDAPMRELLGSILRQEGYRDIAYASDGVQAFSMLSAANAAFELVLLDFEMPGLSGHEVLKKARTLLPDCMWVVVSAHSELPNVLSAISAGAHGFIVKPYNMMKIHEMLVKFDARKTP